MWQADGEQQALGATKNAVADGNQRPHLIAEIVLKLGLQTGDRFRRSTFTDLAVEYAG